MLRWMSSTSVTAVLFVTDLDDAQELLGASVEVLLVARLRKRKALAQLAVDLGTEEQGAALIEFHDRFRSGTRIRTLIRSSKGSCPTIRRSPITAAI